VLPYLTGMYGGSAWAVAAEDDAERVADRVSKDSKAGLTFTGCTDGTKGEQFLLGLIGISHANVEMQLLGIGRIRPARRNPFGDPLERQLAEAWRCADNHPAVDVLIDPHPQHLTVELRQSARVGTVDHCFFEAPDHTESMSARRG
jgi:hypothetical protein